MDSSDAEQEKLRKIKEEARRRVRARAAAKGLIKLDPSELEPAPAKQLVTTDAEPDDDDDDDFAGKAMALLRRGKSEVDKRAAGEKNVWVSGGASTLLGPLGWLYAGSFREAIPASAIYLAIAAIVPNMLLLPIAGIALPASGIVGLVYAWQYNRKGRRTRLFGDSQKKKQKKLERKRRKQLEKGSGES